LDKQTKEKTIAELQDKLKRAQLAILAGYSGLNVEKINALRNELRKAGIEFRVIKNTLFGIASEKTDYAGLKGHLRGPLAVVLTYDDIVTPAKVLSEFARKNAELDVKVGMMGGELLDRKQLEALASLPSKEVLLAKLLSVFVGAQASMVHVLAAVPRSLVQVLNAYRQKREKEN
jgi:large subunit ribosomal protein L10